MRYQWTHITQLHHQENDTEIPRFHTNKAGDSFLDSAGKIVGETIFPGLSRIINEFSTRGLILGNGNKKLDLFRLAIRKDQKSQAN
jgi:hypothetical protein